LIVPKERRLLLERRFLSVKRGNSVTAEDRVEGSEASDHETSGRNYVGCMGIRTPYQ
jgi:hypothetical protein